MANSLAEKAAQTLHSERLSGLQVFGLVFGTALVLVLADMIDGVRFHADVDDQLRALQIGYLLSAKGSWFDLTLPFVATPGLYVSPWSRLIDLPYVALAWLFSWLLPNATALKAAFWTWPVVMLAGFSFLTGFVARHMMRDVRMSRRLKRCHLFS